MIGGAKRITVGQQYRFAVELDQHWIVDQAHAAARLETPAEKKVAIATHDVARHAARRELRECGADLRTIRVIIVVADPALKQITEDVQRLGAASAPREKCAKLLTGRRCERIQMQIGDE